MQEAFAIERYSANYLNITNVGSFFSYDRHWQLILRKEDDNATKVLRKSEVMMNRRTVSKEEVQKD